MILQPLFDQCGPGRIDHAREYLWSNLDHGEPGPLGENGVKDRKRDEPRADHHYMTAGADLLYHALGLLQSPEAVNVLTISPANRRTHRRRARGNEEIVVWQLRAIV